MSNTILFIHGMFQTGGSWKNWVNYFQSQGYNCIAPNWPYHNGEPAELRADPPEELGSLHLDTIVSQMEELIASLPEKPVVIGHSVGGLIVQILAGKALITKGVPISSVAPNAMLAFDWEFFKNSTKIVNPFKGNDLFEMTPEGFHDAFCNTLPENEARIAYQETATHDSRNVLRDCMLAPGHVDLALPHAPLLFIAGEEDHIIPHELVEKNAKAYEQEQGSVEYKLFPHRSHFICCEPGWEEIIAYVHNWIGKDN